ncbi:MULTISPECIES: N-acetyltransferase [unclassified Pseudarthrobacter]|uniref:N-acetyltransferase n=1 Tax=unclassified Pseudarthrobacter TaxID=2647000 RepID=UPI00162616B3|nr:MULTISPECIES: N-acetyltransferase [unclassified Pseudarthrobacter]MBE4718051.1 N-acetyltransferase [Pseudarthrobacter sp. AB1]QNE13819.1 GNAT family N-acetyltransferase [Pseudarthrobacter sp. NBSH8]
MSGPTIRVARLAPGHDLGAFDCGEVDYNKWLTDYAAQAVEAGASMVYLLLEQRPAHDERIVGYFAICPTLVVREDMPKPLQRKVLRNAPGWLLAKLALDRSLRGDKINQWGWQLLRAALETIVGASDLGGGQIIVVDADNPGLVDWYTRHGFASTGGSNLRMYMKVATARKYLGSATT